MHSKGKVEPLAPARYKLQLTASQQLVDKIHEAQDLLRHQIPDGDLAAVVERAMNVLVEQLERKKYGQRKQKPRVEKSATREADREQSACRHIPNRIKRQVAERDQGRCTFADSLGRRCTARGMLEFHHVVPYGRRRAHEVDNLTLRCRAHNQYAAEQDYGKAFMAKRRRRNSPRGVQVHGMEDYARNTLRH